MMKRISQSMWLTAGLLVLPTATAVAQQTNPGDKHGAPSTPGGATLKSTSPGNSGDVGSTTGSSTSGGASLKSTTQGSTGKKTLSGEQANRSSDGK